MFFTLYVFSLTLCLAVIGVASLQILLLGGATHVLNMVSLGDLNGLLRRYLGLLRRSRRLLLG